MQVKTGVIAQQQQQLRPFKFVEFLWLASPNVITSRTVAVFNTAEHVFERMCLCLFLCSVGVTWQDVFFFSFLPGLQY